MNVVECSHLEDEYYHVKMNICTWDMNTIYFRCCHIHLEDECLHLEDEYHHLEDECKHLEDE